MNDCDTWRERMRHVDFEKLRVACEKLRVMFRFVVKKVYLCDGITKKSKAEDMKSRFCVCILGLLLCATQLCAELNITCGTSSGFPIVGTGRQAVLVVDDADADVVRTAAQCVVGDIESVTGRRLTLKSSLAAGDLPIVAGTLGSSPLLDALVATAR